MTTLAKQRIVATPHGLSGNFPTNLAPPLSGEGHFMTRNAIHAVRGSQNANCNRAKTLRRHKRNGRVLVVLRTGAQVVSESDLREITPQTPRHVPTAAHVTSGVPIPKAARIRQFSPDEWEEFIEEWANSLVSAYQKVRRYGGSGDLGIDVVGFASSKELFGEWDNYQCKRYDHPLRPSDAWVEIGKIIYYSHVGEYIAPRAYYFVCPRGVGTKLEKLLGNPNSLKEKLKENWDEYCLNGITSTSSIELKGGLEKHVDNFDFSIFSSKSPVEIIKDHSNTKFHTVRFGGGLPERPLPDSPPELPADSESRYLQQILDAYGDHLGASLPDATSLESHGELKKDYLRQRERFYHAESLKNFARDNVPEGTFDALQDEVFHGVVDVCEDTHDDGLKRMKATLAQAAQVAATTNPLVSTLKTQDRQGICHQLANDDRLTWVPSDE